MKKVRTLILRTAGTNCDKETAFAFKTAGAEADLVHINEVIRDKSMMEWYHILAIPGGFTYGDDIASGKVLANELRYNLGASIKSFVKVGKVVIGICNGFQVLVKMGLLPDTGGKVSFGVQSTLSLNDSGKFEDRWVFLRNNHAHNAKSGDNKCVWTAGLPEIIYLPVAHAEGKFIPMTDKVLEDMKKNGQIAFTYCRENGEKAVYPDNPNGSVAAIAGITDKSGRIFGLMPHPERHMTYLQHPNWRRHKNGRVVMGIGLEIFRNGVVFARDHLLNV